MPTISFLPRTNTRPLRCGIDRPASKREYRSTHFLLERGGDRPRTKTANLQWQIRVVLGPSSRNLPIACRIRMSYRRGPNRSPAALALRSVDRSSCDYRSFENDDGRAIGKKRRRGFAFEDARQFRAVFGSRIASQERFYARPYLPNRMGNLIFEASATPLSRVAPVVFGDELFQTFLCRKG